MENPIDKYGGFNKFHDYDFEKFHDLPSGNRLQKTMERSSIL